MIVTLFSFLLLRLRYKLTEGASGRETGGSDWKRYQRLIDASRSLNNAVRKGVINRRIYNLPATFNI